jgi:hypothetical protein
MTTDPFTSVVKTNPTSAPGEPAGVERDGYGRYKIPPLPADFREQFTAKGYADPGPGVKSWTRVTTFAKAISDTFSLSQWSQRMVAKGIATRPDLYAGAAACQVNDSKTLNSIVEQAKDAAAAKAGANLGTAYHSFTEAIDRGEEPNIPVAEWRKDIDGYVALKNRNALVALPDYIERTVVNTLWEVAGTLDRIYNDSGVLRIGDVKSGKSMDYDNSRQEIAIQLLCYATADAIWDWDRRVFLPLPADLDQSRAIVVHLPVGAEPGLYDVWIDNAAPGASLCRYVRQWRKTKGLFSERSQLSEDLPTPVYGTPDTSDRDGNGGRAMSSAEAGHLIRRSAAAVADRLLGTPNPANTPDTAQDVQDSVPQYVNGTPGISSVVERAEAASAALKKATDAAKDAGVLAPLAGPGQRGCSVCGRTGHRKGSPKCLGDQDPALSAAVETIDLRNGTGGVTAPDWCLRTGPCVAAIWVREIIEDEDGAPLPPEQQPNREVCGNCGKPSRSGQINGTGRPVIGTIGTEGPAAKLFAELERENPDDTERQGEDPDGNAEERTFTTDGPIFTDPFTSVQASTDTEATPIPGADPGPSTVEDGGDPFADDEPAAPTWSERIARAESKAELRDIRTEATAAGEWTKALMSEGIARIAKLES